MKFWFLFVWMSVFLVETIITFSISLLVSTEKMQQHQQHQQPHCVQWMGFAWIQRYKQTDTLTHTDTERDWTTFCNNKTSLCCTPRFTYPAFLLLTLCFCPSPHTLPLSASMTSSDKQIISSASSFSPFCVHFGVFALVLADSVLVSQAIYCRKTFIIIQLRYWFFFEIRKRSCETLLAGSTLTVRERRRQMEREKMRYTNSRTHFSPDIIVVHTETSTAHSKTF